MAADAPVVEVRDGGRVTRVHMMVATRVKVAIHTRCSRARDLGPASLLSTAPGIAPQSASTYERS